MKNTLLYVTLIVLIVTGATDAAVWVSGSNAWNQPSVYGTKGVSDPCNVPGARFGSVSWIDNGGNLWLFGGIGAELTSAFSLNDLWRFDGTNWTWVSGSNTWDQLGIYGIKGVADPCNTPGARRDSVSWIDSSGNKWLFGGYGSDSGGVHGYLNDLWKFNGTNWTWVSGSNTVDQLGIYGTKGVADPCNVPGARDNGVSWIDSTGNLWVFGGWGRDIGNGGYLNDLWKFDGTNWTWASGSNTGNQLGIYGTKGMADPCNVPGGRSGSVSWIDSNGSLWLFGGYPDQHGTHFNDLWKFDGTNWTWVSGSNTVDQLDIYGTKGVADPCNVPGARSEGVSWIDSTGNLWLWGGSTNNDYYYPHKLNDLWKFDGTNWKWVSGSNTWGQSGVYGNKGVADPCNVPGAREGSISWLDSSGNLWLFGGYSGFSGSGNYRCFNDLWKFEACKKPAGDLNGDCKVDFEDFSIMAYHWLEQTEPE